MSNIINEKIDFSNYPQDIASYKPIRIIGRGSFGSLYEGIVLNGPHKQEHVAVKQVTIEEQNIKKCDNFKVSTIYLNKYINKYRMKQTL